MPPFPEVTNPAAVHTAFFFSTPGSVHRATRPARGATPARRRPSYGRRYLLDVAEAATLRMLDDIERTFAAMPPRQGVSRQPGPAAHHAADGQVLVQLDEVGALTFADRHDPAAVHDPEETASGFRGARRRRRSGSAVLPGRDEVPHGLVERDDRARQRRRCRRASPPAADDSMSEVPRSARDRQPCPARAQASLTRSSRSAASAA